MVQDEVIIKDQASRRLKLCISLFCHALRSQVSPALQALSNLKDTCAVCIDNFLTFIDIPSHFCHKVLIRPFPARHGSTALYVMERVANFKSRLWNILS